MYIFHVLLHINVFPQKTAIRHFIDSRLIDMCFLLLPLTISIVFLVTLYVRTFISTILMSKKLFCEATMCAHITQRINRLKAFRWTVVDV